MQMVPFNLFTQNMKVPAVSRTTAGARMPRPRRRPCEGARARGRRRGAAAAGRPAPGRAGAPAARRDAGRARAPRAGEGGEEGGRGRAPQLACRRPCQAQGQGRTAVIVNGSTPHNAKCNDGIDGIFS